MVNRWQKVKLTSWKRTSRTLTTCIVVSWIGKAHMEELACCRGMQVYTRVPVEECASHRSIKTGWVDTKETKALLTFVRLVASDGEETQQT